MSVTTLAQALKIKLKHLQTSLRKTFTSGWQHFLEEPIHLFCHWVQVDIIEAGSSWKAWHSTHLRDKDSYIKAISRI